MAENIDHYEYLKIPRSSDIELINRAILESITTNSEKFSNSNETDSSSEVYQGSRILQILMDFEDFDTKIDYDRCLLNLSLYGDKFVKIFKQHQEMKATIHKWYESKIENLQTIYGIERNVVSKMYEVGSLTLDQTNLKYSTIASNQAKAVISFQRFKTIKLKAAIRARDTKLKQINYD
jgi:hypothetical protein